MKFAAEMKAISIVLQAYSIMKLSRGPQRGCNLVRLACNPGVIFVILILILLL